MTQSKYFAAQGIVDLVKPEMIGVEIGVFVGDSSIEFINRCSYMYFIDPCVEYVGNPDKGYFTPEAVFHEKLAGFQNRYTFIKGFSDKVADQIPLVDFVFIDGNHLFDYVRKDIALYWPKVKAGGFLSGHDYDLGHPDVRRAVHEFAGKTHRVDTHGDCWVIHKI